MVGTYRPNILLNCAEMKVTNNYTANAKDVEVIKKVHGFWVIHLKN